ncbi:hypothetical protein [Pseudochryseolinea flava]|uniref:Uncharacterized protein n=1 Tax=Pseudochryseolinea flava TaxID=2059302 RepID=A0A364XWU5_9BACT|nr:hypothetical protein [Pseudochryseolinea flava]RAV98225.1 hypothetical protein DQQ10_24805 [Pseudochryseolinea flava]
MKLDVFKDVGFKNFDSWFAELAAVAEDFEDSSNLPKLELSLRNGHVIRGSILKAQNHLHEQRLMVLGLLDPYAKSEITFVTTSEVVAFTLIEPENYVRMKSSNQKSVGSLELKRAIKNVGVELEKVLQFQIQLNVDADAVPENNRWDVLRTLGFLPSLFMQIAADDVGKKIVKDNIDTISIVSAVSNKTTLQYKTLSLAVATPLAIPVTKEKERLKTEIEGVL